jgi:hypothetical protein
MEPNIICKPSALDWARKIQWLVDTWYPSMEKTVLVMNKLNTHVLSSLYETFAPEEAFPRHFTPQTGKLVGYC